MKSTSASLSIIIPTLNEQDYLPKLLESIVDQNYSGVYEVIVVDGGSTDKTRDIVKEYQKRLPALSLHSSDRGTARQRNLGATISRYNNLVFLDGDTYLTKKTLIKLSRYFTAKKDFVAIPLLYPYDGKSIDLFFATASYIYFLCVSHTNPILSGMCIITTKQIHNRIGGFNESMRHAEDIDYGLRAYRNHAKYHIFFNVRVTSSARRLDQIGRTELGLMWLKWYKKVRKNNELSNGDALNYEFGKFKKR